MKIVPVVNEELLEILNQYSCIKDMEGFTDNLHLFSKERENEKEYLLSEEYLEELMTGKRDHDGFPEVCHSYDFRLNSKDHQFFRGNSNPSWNVEFLKKVSDLNGLMMTFLGTRNNALCALYPPGGFISWHNNANASGYNLIFTWSEKGEGWFKYVDPETQKVVTVEDKPGWQCKAAYFGGFHEPEKIFYHAAKSDCWRLTLSYVFNTSELANEFREDIIEEISSSVE